MAGAGLDPYRELEDLAEEVARESPCLPPARAAAEMARRLAVRPGWAVVDDPDPHAPQPSFVAYCGEEPPVVCSRSWLRLLAKEERDRLAC